uniref:Putative secreted peptide n=1 Tax=Anopheles braziliensis TaxID=58242 RepID=A0A2M3ZQH3_9DIPT
MISYSRERSCGLLFLPTAAVAGALDFPATFGSSSVCFACATRNRLRSSVSFNRVYDMYASRYWIPISPVVPSVALARSFGSCLISSLMAAIESLQSISTVSSSSILAGTSFAFSMLLSSSWMLSRNRRTFSGRTVTLRPRHSVCWNASMLSAFVCATRLLRLPKRPAA